MVILTPAAASGVAHGLCMSAVTWNHVIISANPVNPRRRAGLELISVHPERTFRALTGRSRVDLCLTRPRLARPCCRHPSELREGPRTVSRAERARAACIRSGMLRRFQWKITW